MLGVLINKNGQICSVFFSNRIQNNDHIFLQIKYFFVHACITCLFIHSIPTIINIHARSTRDGAFLPAESRWDVLTRRAEIGRSCSHPTILC